MPLSRYDSHYSDRPLGPGCGVPPRLVIGIGNPSRGDDAIGPLAIERLQRLELTGVELLTDFQLQVEHALDLMGRREVVFIDAATSGAEPYSFSAVQPVADASATTHALSPAAVLAALLRISEEQPPPAFVLAVRGYDFELGAALSGSAARNLDAALEMLVSHLAA